MRRKVFNAVVAVGCLAGSAMVPVVYGQSARDERPDPLERSKQESRDSRPAPDRPGLDRPGVDRPLRLNLNTHMPLVKAAYLGVATSVAPKALRHQVDLPDGVGLVVDTIAPDSPAAAAGLQQHDLLHKLDDQLLINPQQLAVLVRTRKAGESVRLTVIRGGKPVELTAKLTDRDLPPLDELRLGLEPRLTENPLVGGFPDYRLGQIVTGTEAFPRPGGPAIPFTLINQNGAITWNDGTLLITIRVENGKQSLTARDKNGKELFDGPIDTEDQRSKLPAEVRERLNKLPGVMPGNAPPEGNRPEGNRPDGGPRPGGQRPEGQRPEVERQSDSPRSDGAKPQPPPQPEN